MALEDWKRKQPGKNRIYFENKKYPGEMYRRYIQIEYAPAKKYWIVEYVESGQAIWFDTFLTKEEELAYARSYMRTH